MTDPLRGRVATAVAVVGLQIAAALYFIADAWAEMDRGAFAVTDLIVGAALLAGAVFGAVALRHLLAEARQREQALTIARGALGTLVEQRFTEWNLSRSEADVALFALKGCTIAEIAALRRAAEGTVRSQLSQVYGKAGVTGQPMLMSLFLDDLLEGTPLAQD